MQLQQPHSLDLAAIDSVKGMGAAVALIRRGVAVDVLLAGGTGP